MTPWGGAKGRSKRTAVAIPDARSSQTCAGEHARLPRDIDLLGRSASSVNAGVAQVPEVLAVEVDDGFGDAVVPEPRWVESPRLRELEAPSLRGLS